MDEEPTIRKVLVDEEHRWRDRIDKVCEGNQDLTEIRDAISDVRMRRKREFRLQQQIAKLASKATKSRPSGPLQARIEEIEDDDKEAPSIPDPPVPETGRTLPLLLPSPLLPPVVESARQDIVREVRSSEASHTGNPVGVVSSTKPATRVETPTLSPQVVLPSVRCIVRVVGHVLWSHVDIPCVLIRFATIHPVPSLTAVNGVEKLRK